MSRVSGGKIADADALGSTRVVWKVQMRGEAQGRVANQSLGAPADLGIHTHMWISRGDRKVAKRGGAEAEAERCRCCCARAPSRGATTMRISFRESETFEVV